MTSRYVGFASVLAAVCFAAGLAHAQAGRVLMAVGDVSVERSGQTVPLAVGSAIEAKDLIRVGADSNAQIRFSDESIVALRANTVFRVDNYNFSGREDLFSQAVFSLVRGGFRTITGLIGKTQRDRYKVNGPKATVGIRGTSYTLVVCQRDCFEADGTLAPDGDYGLVQEGRIAVSNDGGTTEFGVDEAFFVSDPKTQPQPLVGRPGFLRDRLEARARQERDRPGQQVAGREPPRQGPPDPRKDDPREIRPLPSNPAAPIGATDIRDESGNVAVLGAGLGVGIAWATVPAERAQVEGGRGTVITVDPQTKALEGFAFFTGGMTGSRQGASIKDPGGIPGDGGMAWGRWDGGVVNTAGQTFSPPTGVHFLYGNLTPPTALATATSLRGTLEYDYVGGPGPTDAQGHTGQMLTSSFTVDFLNRSISGGVSYRVGDVTYKIPVPTGTPLIGGQGFVGFGINRNDHGNWQCACNGQSGTIDSASISGLFMGSRAQGLGVTFSTRDTQAGLSAGVAAFRCRTGKC
jgi:hypothetical protein